MLGYIRAKIGIIIGFSNLYTEYLSIAKCLICFFLRHLILQITKQRRALCVSKKNGVILHREDANENRNEE